MFGGFLSEAFSCLQVDGRITSGYEVISGSMPRGAL